MNRYPDFNYESVQSWNESQGSNSVGFNSSFKWNSLSQEEYMDSQESSNRNYAPVAIQAKNSLAKSTSRTYSEAKLDSDQLESLEPKLCLASTILKENSPIQRENTLSNLQESNMDSHKIIKAKNFTRKFELHADRDESDNTDIQNFVRTLRKCTYPSSPKIEHAAGSAKILEPAFEDLQTVENLPSINWLASGSPYANMTDCMIIGDSDKALPRTAWHSSPVHSFGFDPFNDFNNLDFVSPNDVNDTLTRGIDSPTETSSYLFPIFP